MEIILCFMVLSFFGCLLISEVWDLISSMMAAKAANKRCKCVTCETHREKFK